MHDDTALLSHEPAEASGRFVLRIMPGLHAALRAAAGLEGVSLNDYCARKLAAPGAGLAGPGGEAVTRAAALLGEDLVGVLAYGSWARRQLAADSDVDLLVVLSPRVDIRRELYRRWDADSPLRWDAHAIEPHFVHLPESGARISGVWAEAAVEGVVLFEVASALSLRLVEIRRRIVGGDFVRRTAHGQSYWVEAPR